MFLNKYQNQYCAAWRSALLKQGHANSFYKRVLDSLRTFLIALERFPMILNEFYIINMPVMDAIGYFRGVVVI